MLTFKKSLVLLVAVQLLSMPVAHAFVPFTVDLPGETEQKPSPAYQCVVDLCGPARVATDRLSVQQRSWSQTPVTKVWFQKNIEPLLDANIEAVWQREDLERASLIFLLERMDREKVSKSDSGLLAFAVASTILSNIPKDKQTSLYVLNEDNGWDIDAKQFEKLTPTLVPRVRSVLVKILHFYITAPINGFLRQLDSNMGKDFFFNVVERHLGPQSTASLGRILLNLTTKVQGEFGADAIEPSVLKIIQRAISGAELSDVEFKSFVSAFLMIYRIVSFSDILNESLKNSDSLSGRDAILALGLTPASEDLRPVDVATKRELSAKVKAKYRKAIEVFLSAAPTTQEIKSALDLSESIKQTAALTVSKISQLSPGQIAAVQEKIRDVSFFFPVDREVAMLQMLVELRSDLDNEKMKFEIFRKMTTGELHFSGVALLHALSDLGSGESVHLGNLIERAENLKPQEPTDSSYSGARIRLSWQSVKMPSVGVSIIAHELGHEVSRQLDPEFSTGSHLFPFPPYDGITSVRMCTIQQHIDSGSFQKLQPVLNAEEDWADVFAMAVMKARGGLPANTLNPVCVFIAKDPMTEAYLPLQLENPYKNDTHSSGYYRLLQYQIGLGQLPSSCQEALGPLLKTSFGQSCAR